MLIAFVIGLMVGLMGLGMRKIVIASAIWGIIDGALVFLATFVASMSIFDNLFLFGAIAGTVGFIIAILLNIIVGVVGGVVGIVIKKAI